MPGEIVTVNVTKRADPSDRLGTQYQSAAASDATLAELRAILVDDGCMEAADKFFVDGRALGKSMENTMKWSAAAKVCAMVCFNGRTSQLTLLSCRTRRLSSSAL